jgi:dipeptidyl aminopeptidase/acylaminoacyl peptidase
MKKNATGSVILILLLFQGFLSAQTVFTEIQYRQADSLVNQFNDKVYHQVTNKSWVKGRSVFWYEVRTLVGKEYYLVDAAKPAKKQLFNMALLCDKLIRQSGKNYKPYAIPFKNILLDSTLRTMKFDADTGSWKWDLKSNQLTYMGKVKEAEKEGKYWGEPDLEQEKTAVLSPDKKYEAFIRDYNVFLRRKSDSKELQLSYDGSAGGYYSSYLLWSPNSKYLATTNIRPGPPHYIYFVESSPLDQLQPKLQQRYYLKPGDALPVKRPCLFNIGILQQVTVDGTPFENQFSLENLSWRQDSRAFTFEFNQRGHQRYQVVEVSAQTGQTSIMVDETCNTFFFYSGKKFRYDLNDGREMIWMSERDGWNHLYLLDAAGHVKNPITQGEWVVREVVQVDTLNRQILFSGSGRNPGEDPYLIHYYRVGFDGEGLTDLTPEPANHTAEFSADYRYLIDEYSRVDMPPVAVLRSAIDGQVISKLEEADITELKKLNWNTPEVFAAKGRDGTTDIWGIIYRPTSFDPGKKYPVIESIYAGPHDSFVPKSFIAKYYYAGMAELGFIVLQIDGMGTSNRSKAFHDVCWHNLKDAGFPDRILWIRAAAQTRPYMDTSRVGLFGTSAGGQSTLAGLLFHPEFYKVGVASCGCHDNRMDKIWWNEQWMGYPIGPWYAECSNVDNAYRLKGKLMLFVGELDDNVDPSSTYRVADALIKAGKEFELVVLPGMNHTSGGKYGERKRRDFFVENLLGAKAPKWNE